MAESLLANFTASIGLYLHSFCIIYQNYNLIWNTNTVSWQFLGFG